MKLHSIAEYPCWGATSGLLSECLFLNVYFNEYSPLPSGCILVGTVVKGDKVNYSFTEIIGSLQSSITANSFLTLQSLSPVNNYLNVPNASTFVKPSGALKWVENSKIKYLVGVHVCFWCIRQWWNIEGVGHQVLLSIHQVLQLLLIQETLEELAIVGTRQLHTVVTLRKKTRVPHYISWCTERKYGPTQT